MPWVRLDDQFPHHPKVVSVGPLGIAMQVVGLCYCNQFLTDGFIPTSAIPTFMDFTELDANAFNGRGGVCWIAVQKLLDAGMWEEAEGGYRIHDYLEYQPSKASIEAEKERNRVAGQHSAQRRVQQGVQHLPNTMSTQSQSRSHTQEREKEPLSTEVRKKKRKVEYTLLSAAALMELHSKDDLEELHRVFPLIDLAWEAGKCVDWHNAKNGAANWKLSFKNWLGNAKPTNGGSNGQRTEPTPERIIYKSTPDANGNYAPAVIPKTMLIDPRIKRGL